MTRKTLYIVALFSITVLVINSCSKEIKIKQKFNSKTRASLKDSIPRLGYKEVFNKHEFENLTMLGRAEKDGVHGQRNYGMMLRCLRFQNITRKIERRYGLQKNLLLAMVMQESGGIDLLPNSSDDGGLGLCHMQPSVATRFGLKIYENCNDLINKKHGKAIRTLIAEHAFDKKELIKYDDRFHPILNLDAAARMLAFYASGKQYKKTPAQTAIYRYAGAKNYEKYYEQLKLYISRLNDKKLIEAVRRGFNEINSNFKIDGEKSDFDDYIKTHQELNYNYGLREY